MAEDEDVKKTEEPKAESEEKATSGGGILPWLIMAAVVLILSVLGFVFGRVFSPGPHVSEAGELVRENEQAENIEQTPARSQNTSSKGWYYDLEPVATNLNTPGATRYVRATLTFEMYPDVEQSKAKKFLDEQQPVLRNLLNIYFAGLRIEDTSSDTGLRRIQSEMCDIFNEKLYPNAKPQIKQILFKEFGVQ